jgi:tRNA nucleotidyltransferase (CCA-adding enzyme)
MVGKPVMAGSREIDPGRLGEQVEALEAIGQLRSIAERVPAYLVGGVVRDLLLGRDVADLDVAIEGDAEALMDLPGFSLERDALFLTGRLEQGDVKVDVAQTRAESYPAPGALPEVRPASIDEDLARRDFTINAMAFPLGGDGELLDPQGGLEDLRAGELRILHDGSFVDDPTRALRAARYAARFGFRPEPETERLLRDADLSTVSEDRTDKELAHIAAGEDPAAALRLIAEWGVMPSLDPGAPDRVSEVARLASAPPWSGWADRELAVTLAIVRPLPQIRELAAATPERPSEGSRLAEPWDPAQLLVARALGAEWLDRYAAEWRHVALEIRGDDLLEAGIPEGPAVGRGLEAALSGKLDGEFSGREEELRIALAAARGEIPEG